jgi:hypothetical protein
MRMQRAQTLGAALAAIAAFMLVAYAQSALAAPTPAVGATGEPTGPTTTPVPSPTPTVPDPTPTPTATEPPEFCTLEPTPSPSLLRVTLANPIAAAGPVTCSNRHSIITVSWDGTNIKIVIKPNPDFSRTLTCTLDPKSVKVTEPKGATVDKDGVVTLPYDKDKKVKITIKIEYDINCTNGDFTVPLRDVVTIEFTPPDGPIVVTNRSR